jgi:hypothetical protein
MLPINIVDTIIRIILANHFPVLLLEVNVGPKA